MLGAFGNAGWQIEPEPTKADAIVVNTCGFIESAKQESVEAILEAAENKTHGRCKLIAVAGCLSQRYGEELLREIPEIDALVGIGKNEALPGIIAEAMKGERVADCTATGTVWTKHGRRVRSTPHWTAYLRISDGCNNRCSYCAIPDIRGPYNSRPPELILAEAQRMAAEGVLEINLIGQDVTRYGEDVPGWTLAKLAGEIAQIDGIRWIRLLYCYPTRISDELIEAVASEPKIVKYMDIPLQHGDDSVLRAMNRRGSRSEYLATIRKLRESCPEIAFRTSLIVGFPGEGRQEFANLLSFVEEIDFDRIGAFIYSQEDGTPAAKMPGQVRHDTAERRYDRLMRLAGEISASHNQSFIGRKIQVLVESPDTGRSYRDAPEIDGLVRLTRSKLVPGRLVTATVIDADDYDLVATVE